MNLPEIFVKLVEIFEAKGHSIYLVGGASRDFLLGKEIEDYDFATTAIPEEMEEFLPEEDRHVTLGSFTTTFMGKKVDITTLRKESEYEDARHPNEIKYIKSLREDARRRDFTVNAIYIDSKGKIHDYYHGLDDLKNNFIAMIGNPEKRLKEDPIRILRALRFSLEYGFSITPSLSQAIHNCIPLLRKTNYAKALDEMEKMRAIDLDKANWIFKIHHLDEYIPTKNNYLNRLNVIDMHCDTITREQFKENPYSNDLHIDFKKLCEGEYLMQVCAVFINLGKTKTPYMDALNYIDNFKKKVEEYDFIVQQVTNIKEIDQARNKKKIGLMLSLEEGGIIEGSLDRLQDFYDLGVRMMTLTWNYPNEIACGNIDARMKKPDLTTPNTQDGLTPFGIEVVKKMNELGMIIDVSHLSDKGFYDVIKYSTKPIVASHSNARSVHNVVRNMTDDMLLALKENGGIVGMNYCPSFVSKSKKNQIEDIVDHIVHIKELIGINHIALGSDFDGIPTPKGMSDCTKTLELAKALKKRGFKKAEIEKIFHDNFLRVLKKNQGK